MECGSLQTLMKKYSLLIPETLAAVYSEEILRGLAYLHGQGVVHCDLKVSFGCPCVDVKGSSWIYHASIDVPAYVFEKFHVVRQHPDHQGLECQTQ